MSPQRSENQMYSTNARPITTATICKETSAGRAPVVPRSTSRFQRKADLASGYLRFGRIRPSWTTEATSVPSRLKTRPVEKARALTFLAKRARAKMSGRKCARVLEVPVEKRARLIPSKDVGLPRAALKTRTRP